MFTGTASSGSYDCLKKYRYFFVSMFLLSNRWRFIPVLLSMMLIFYASHQPGESINLIDIPNVDKLLHSLVYAVLAYSALIAVSPAIRIRNVKTVGILVVMFCLVYGVTDEYHQSFIPGRSSSIWDMLADTLGAGLAVISWFRYIEQRLIDKKK